MTKHWPLFEELFGRAVTALKRNFPALKVGGPGLGLSSYCTPDPASGRPRVGGQGVEMQPFIEKLVREKVPVDFISWHRYANFPERVTECAQEVRAMLPTAWEMYVTEWNLGVAGPFNTTAAASMTTAMWIGLQDYADGSFMYWGCCAEFPYSASGLGAAGDGLALFAANASVPWKPQALAFAMWHNFSLHPSRRAVAVSGDSMTPLVALAGTSSSGELAVLIANPQNRSVSFSVSVPGGQPLCSVAAACAIVEIQDNSGQVVESSSAGGNVSIAAWGTMMARQTDDSVIKTDDELPGFIQHRAQGPGGVGTPLDINDGISCNATQNCIDTAAAACNHTKGCGGFSYIPSVAESTRAYLFAGGGSTVRPTQCGNVDWTYYCRPGQCGAPCPAPLPPSPPPQWVVNNKERQLFVDELGVASMENLRLTMHPPKKKGAVIRPFGFNLAGAANPGRHCHSALLSTAIDCHSSRVHTVILLLSLPFLPKSRNDSAVPGARRHPDQL
jgi:hypothetical protein